MKVLIIEDEGIAAQRLAQLLYELDHTIEFVGQLDSVKSAVNWFQNHAEPDLAFFDIQLADGSSFEIFDQVKINCPIIFTTAYDQYAIQAFKVNSVDYLLKPLVKSGLQQAIAKFKEHGVNKNLQFNSTELISLLQGQTKKYKERFVIKVGDHLRSIMTADAEIIFSRDKTTYLHTHDGKDHILDFALDQVEELIDPALFFRINRRYIVHLDSLSDIIVYSNSRLKLILKQFEADDLIVARERVGQFKEWLDR